VRLGVPASACVVEPHSRNTAENARFSAAMLRRMGIGEVVVTSDPYHLLRARQLFRREGFEVHTSPALETERNTHWPDRVVWTLREVAALVAHPGLLVRGPVETLPAADQL
jgi:uncharacterized SAM-binding protein YcdF (DUF218 family)